MVDYGILDYLWYNVVYYNYMKPYSLPHETPDSCPH